MGRYELALKKPAIRVPDSLEESAWHHPHATTIRAMTMDVPCQHCKHNGVEFSEHVCNHCGTYDDYDNFVNRHIP